MRHDTFHFKQFSVENYKSPMPITSDSVLIGAWCRVATAQRVLDVGTGTGVIALMIAQRNPDCLIDAIDIDHNSIGEANHNFQASPWSNRLRAMHCDFNDWVGQYDLIVSNPPFFTHGIHSPKQSRADARHTDSLTFEQLIAHSRAILTPNGRLVFITPHDARKAVIETAVFNSMNISRMCSVVSSEGKSPVRIMWEFSKAIIPQANETLTMRNAAGAYTDEYCKLCRDFYLDFTE